MICLKYCRYGLNTKLFINLDLLKRKVVLSYSELTKPYVARTNHLRLVTQYLTKTYEHGKYNISTLCTLVREHITAFNLCGDGTALDTGSDAMSHLWTVHHNSYLEM